MLDEEEAPMPDFCMEHDLLGDARVPIDCYCGIQTLRAIQNFDITGVPIAHSPNLIRVLAMVKKACALAYYELGNWAKAKKDAIVAIVAACEEVMEGHLADQFPVDFDSRGSGSGNFHQHEYERSDC